MLFSRNLLLPLCIIGLLMSVACSRELGGYVEPPTPIDTTKNPVDTTTNPVDTTTNPVDTTTTPVDTTNPDTTTPAPIVVTVSPATITLAAGQNVQMNATISGQASQAVTWSIAPAFGTISVSGLYQVPATVTAANTVTVKAVAVSNPAKSGTATVTVTYTPPANDSICFSRQVLPIILGNCAMTGCHNRVQDDVPPLNTFAGIRSLVTNFSDPDRSKLLKYILEDDEDDVMPPPPMTPLSQAEIDILRKWIREGAKQRPGCN